MDHTSVDIYLVIDTFLLLLIGIGPKIALVPFLEVTATMDVNEGGRRPQDAHHRGCRRGHPRRTRRVRQGCSISQRGRYRLPAGSSS